MTGCADGAEDPDADGLANLAEQAARTHPRIADTDGDGLGDATDPDPTHPPAPVVPGAEGCTVFPVSNVWNRRVDTLPVRSDSSTLIGSIGRDKEFHMDFGSYEGYGIPYQVVDSETPRRAVTFDYDDESDPGPYPIPDAPLVEAGSDRHMLLLDKDACRLYELYDAQLVDGAWQAGSGAQWDLDSNALRPLDWTSADAAGLPDPARARPLRRAGRRADPPCAPVHRAGDPQGVHLPGPPLRLELDEHQPAADGAAGPPQGDGQPCRAVAAGTGDRGRAPALRDDPRGQRLALVRVGHVATRGSTTTSSTSSTGSPAPTSRP